VGPQGIQGPVGPVGPVGATGPTGPGITTLAGGSGIDSNCGGTPFGVLGPFTTLDWDQVDQMGLGRVVENSCNAFSFPGFPIPSDVWTPLPVGTTCGGVNGPFRVQLSGALIPIIVGTICEFEFEVQDNGADTGIVCTVSNGNAPPGNTSCVDAVHSFTFAGGDKISVEVSPSPIFCGLPGTVEVAGWSLGCSH
jgi:hypothetical protein